MIGLVLLLFVTVVGVCTWGGVKVIGFTRRPPKDPAIPPARIANVEGGEATYARAIRAASRSPRAAGKLVGTSLGFGLIVAPWIAAYIWVMHGLSNMHLMDSKGRVLRIKNRAQLATLATGEGWSGAEVVLEGTLSPGEREVLGALWLLTARMEHASVAAFAQLSLHLAAVGAPAHLLEATHRAALDEIRHAERCFAIARAITGVAHTAGPIGALDGAGRGAPIDLTRLAIGSLVDGCVAEGIAADVAACSADRAAEPTIRETLAMIAREEAGHAELAWSVLDWCLARGGADVTSAVTARVAALTGEIAPRLPAIRGIDAVALARYGVIDQDTLGTTALARIAAVQARARRMLDDVAPRRAA